MRPNLKQLRRPEGIKQWSQNGRQDGAIEEMKSEANISFSKIIEARLPAVSAESAGRGKG